MVGNLISFVKKYEHYLSPGMLLLGFIIDSLTLTRADTRLDNLILFSYLLIAGVCILLLNAYDAGHFKSEKIQRLLVLLPLAIQFAFGGLFSGFTVLYSRSSSFAASWPFIAALGALLVGNEYFRSRYRRLAFQIGIYFTAIFSYLIFAIPVLLNEIGSLMFIVSGAVSLIFIGILVYLLHYISPEIIQPHKRTLPFLILGIYLGFNALYFLNIIPPIPLVLKEALPVHSLTYQGQNFIITYEEPKWYHVFSDFNPTFHRVNKNPVYIYSSIYAPADIGTTIIHEWSFYDEINNEWVGRSKLQYYITGGRQDGFRGYSLKTNVTPGKWKVTIKTKNGQILGRVKFNIVEALEKPELQTAVK